MIPRSIGVEKTLGAVRLVGNGSGVSDARTWANWGQVPSSSEGSQELGYAMPKYSVSSLGP